MDTRKVLWVVAVCAILGPALAVLTADQETNFCTLMGHRLQCVFKNTSEDVEVVRVSPGVREVKVEAAATLHGIPPCGTNLQVWSSTNVTLQGTVTQRAMDAMPELRRKRISNEHKVEHGASASRGGPPRGETVHFSTSVETVSSSSSKEHVSYSVSVEERGANCVRNVFVVQSKLHWLRGKFDLTSLKLSEVDDLDGEFGQLNVQNSKVSNFSASGRQILIEKTSIGLLSRLEVENQLQLRDVQIERLIAPGLVHQRSGRRKRIYFNNEAVHSLNNVEVSMMETGAMRVVSERVSVTNLKVDEVGSAAITVEAGGSLTLTNVHIGQGPQSCLILSGASSVVINNFTLGNDTITNLELSSNSSQKIAYPLYTIVAASTDILPKNGEAVSTPGEDADKTDRGLVGFSWYWVIIMTAVGIFAGIVIGTAIMWRKPGMTRGEPSVLTLSDLISRDRQQEETENHVYDTPQHLELTRQDSGLTSSSFASFTPCQEKSRRLSSVSQKQQQDPDVCQSIAAEPNIYVLACTHEDIIYEEVEALEAQKLDDHYLAMK
ncbi:uncharacterized protein LOC121869972 [Homarus americanus]|uniref:Uncharacterized protein n=1 Tax=Homarus americanus TaxID=6706 RepID=A0A8J5JYJ2_HOMAM|nr:uncharacterized protein LOC121869972 [Homarus americanus]KAG7165961.1 hypothetical protein Hamer_G011878 [Homarus americanus]